MIVLYTSMVVVTSLSLRGAQSVRSTAGQQGVKNPIALYYLITSFTQATSFTEMADGTVIPHVA